MRGHRHSEQLQCQPMENMECGRVLRMLCQSVMRMCLNHFNGTSCAFSWVGTFTCKCSVAIWCNSLTRFCLLSGSCVFNMRVRCINCQRCLAAAECGSHNLLAAMRMDANNVCVNLCMQRFARYCEPPKSWCNCFTWFAPSCVIFFLEAADEQQLVCACGNHHVCVEHLACTAHVS
jgi:hypothetical protein